MDCREELEGAVQSRAIARNTRGREPHHQQHGIVSPPPRPPQPAMPPWEAGTIQRLRDPACTSIWSLLTTITVRTDDRTPTYRSLPDQKRGRDIPQWERSREDFFGLLGVSRPSRKPDVGEKDERCPGVIAWDPLEVILTKRGAKMPSVRRTGRRFPVIGFT